VVSAFSFAFARLVCLRHGLSASGMACPPLAGGGGLLGGAAFAISADLYAPGPLQGG